MPLLTVLCVQLISNRYKIYRSRGRPRKGTYYLARHRL